MLQDRVKQVGNLNAHIADWLAVSSEPLTEGLPSSVRDDTLTRTTRSGRDSRNSTLLACASWREDLRQAMSMSLGMRRASSSSQQWSRQQLTPKQCLQCTMEHSDQCSREPRRESPHLRQQDRVGCREATPQLCLSRSPDAGHEHHFWEPCLNGARY